ncbi:MAG TPA: RnfABCDGE type electron transport complex subunit G [Rhodocyclaceae bacterium]|nr:RnfABCDGE type electron transport complex subunit G [Rhodocyclaceae bacterium]
MKKDPWIHAIVLASFCLGLGTVLAVTDRLTANEIAALGEVLPPAHHDNDPLDDVLVFTDAHGRPVTMYRGRLEGRVSGVAYEIVGTGYAGEIRLMLGVAADGRVLGVRTVAHRETPGLGDKIEVRKDDWILHFTGLALGHPPADKWAVRKDGGEFDQFTGATVTPRAVLDALRGGLELFAAHRDTILEMSDGQ